MATSATPDELQELMRGVVRRDRAAFAALYDRAAPQLFGIALRILRQKEEAEDVLQEAFVAVWDRAASFDPERGSVMTWLVTVLRYRAIDRRRRRAHLEDRLGSEDDLLALTASATDQADRGASLAALQKCLGELEEQPRRAVLLAYAYGYTHEELAKRLTTPIGTVKSWVRRSLERLKRCLDG
jgi:RNA polymerase sigma-70 factor (ECF subfamily)